MALAVGHDARAGSGAVPVDGLERWDDARWWVQTQVIVPQPIVLSAPDAGAVAVDALYLSYMIGCEHESGGTRRQVVVVCVVQQVSLQAAPWGGVAPVSAAPIFAIRDLLVGLPLRLRVRADGTVRGIALDSAHMAPMRAAQVDQEVRELFVLGLAGLDLYTPAPLRDGASWRSKRALVAHPPSLRHVGRMVPPRRPDAVRGFEFEYGMRRDAMRPVPWDLSEAPQGEVARAYGGKTHDDAPPGVLGGSRLPAWAVNDHSEVPAASARRLASRAARLELGFLDLAVPERFGFQVDHEVVLGEDGLLVADTIREGRVGSVRNRERTQYGVGGARFVASSNTLAERVWYLYFPSRILFTRSGVSGHLIGVAGRVQRVDPSLPMPEVGPSGFVSSPHDRVDDGAVPWPAFR